MTRNWSPATWAWPTGSDSWPGPILGLPAAAPGAATAAGQAADLEVIRTILVTTAASLLAGLVAYVIDRLLGLQALTEHGGGVGLAAASVGARA